MTNTGDLIESDRRIRASAQALGPALAAVEAYAPPALARAVQAEQNLYDRIEAEFGLLTATEAGRLMGSRSGTPRNLASAARREGRVVSIQRRHQALYPAFQFAADGEPLPVVSELRALGGEHGWSETGIVQWLCAPTTYLDGRRPVELLHVDPEAVVDAAAHAWSVEW